MACPRSWTYEMAGLTLDPGTQPPGLTFLFILNKPDNCVVTMVGKYNTAVQF